MSQTNRCGKWVSALSNAVPTGNWRDVMKQVLIYGVLLLGIAIAPAVYFYYNCYQCNEPSCMPQQQPGIVTVQYTSPKVKDMVIGEEFGLMAVRIMDGHIFQVQLENSHWVEAPPNHGDKR
jgi:hypothetical protein